MSANEDVEMQDVSDEEEEEEIQSELGLEGWSTGPHFLFLTLLTHLPTEPSDSEEESEEDEEDQPPPLAKGERNSHLTVGYKGDRSYVVRGSKIGYFTRGSDHTMKYGGTIDGITTTKGKEFKPNQVHLMMLKGERVLIIARQGYAARPGHQDDLEESW
jgi:hypothetical protein